MVINHSIRQQDKRDLTIVLWLLGISVVTSGGPIGLKVTILALRGHPEFAIPNLSGLREMVIITSIVSFILYLVCAGWSVSTLIRPSYRHTWFLAILLVLVGIAAYALWLPRMTIDLE